MGLLSEATGNQQPGRDRLAFIMELMGCGTALVTPFRRDGGVDEPALHSLVNWQIESGIDFLVPCGTTGEASTLTEPEWLRVIEVVVAAAAGRIPVFAGCTHNATHEAVARAKKLSQVHGLTGILTANPYYNRPGQEGQYQHFKAIAEATELPVLLYNIPSRTGANLEPATVLRLAGLRNVIGIKERGWSQWPRMRFRGRWRGWFGRRWRTTGWKHGGSIGSSSS
jgi:4-hydroxy-tetrahydrodipicolinate synthase